MSHTSTYHQTQGDELRESGRSRSRIQDHLNDFQQRDLTNKIQKNSPDGRPAHPTFKAKEIFMLMTGSVVAVIAISGATYALWGPIEALLVFGLGIIFALGANPVIWAMILRSKERETFNKEYKLPSVEESSETGAE